MASEIENLLARRAAILAELAAGENLDKPTYSKDGQSVDWAGYKRGLYEELESIEARIAAVQGPFEADSRGVS